MVDISEGGATTAASRNAAAVGRIPHPYIQPDPAAAVAPAPEPEAVEGMGGPDSGPTVAEWVAKGYPASKYPPEGYNSKSTAEEIAAAVAAEDEAAKAKAAGEEKLQPLP